MKRSILLIATAVSAARMIRGRAWYLTVVSALVAGATLVPLAAGSGAGTFSLHAEVPWQGGPAACVGSYPPSVACYGRPGGQVAVPGLGFVSQSYTYPVDLHPGTACPGGFHVLPYSARLVVRGKGEIVVAVAAAEGCLQGPPSDTVLSPTQTFTVTRGSGVYAGASGTGIVSRTRIGRAFSGHGYGTDVWEGSLFVPGLEFDLVPPAITGAIDKAVRAPRGVTRVRVRYLPAATDDVDGAVPVACRPRSGSLFRVGRPTIVRCSATDKSANTVGASFTVTVRRP